MRAGRQERGFTLIEGAVAIAIIAVLAALAWSNLGRLRPRSSLVSAGLELQSLIHGARQSALSTGHDVAVLVFPVYPGPLGTGRVIVYEDGNFDFFSAAAAVNFDGYNPASPAAGSRSQVLTTMDLPAGITVGPLTGMGTSAVLPAPLAGIDVTKDCSFCGALVDRRGAIKFDARGRVSFYGSNGAPSLGGGSLSLTSTDVGGQRTLVITPTTGSVRAIYNG